MAISQPIALGTASAGDGVTVVLTAAAQVPVGSCIVVSTSNSGSAAATSCTDSAGNVYSRIQTAANGGGVSSAVFVALNAALPAGGTISVVGGNAGGGTVIAATAFTGVGTVLAETVDQFAGNLGSDTAPTTSTVTTTFAEELIIGVFGIATTASASSPSATADYPFAHAPVNSVGSFIRTVVTTYRLVGTVGSYAASAALAAAWAWCGVIVTLKSGAPPAPTTTFLPTSTFTAGGWTTTASGLHVALADDTTDIVGVGV